MPFAFKIDAESEEQVEAALVEKIAVEVRAVQAYGQTWRSSGAMAAAPPRNVEDVTQQAVQEAIYAWPQIGELLVPEREDGRWVKAFPLQFPMGVADLRQPRLRCDFHVWEVGCHHFVALPMD